MSLLLNPQGSGGLRAKSAGIAVKRSVRPIDPQGHSKGNGSGIIRLPGVSCLFPLTPGFVRAGG
ncbi:hypothetical protein TMES_05645 [Thalassospira mesophila]|uniref:Uncharacterized protein n=1 Tax=Thalassospira mesophila TaxID=1293891 RepID=A0A1Y2L219_9PROT|nr:hypothetical protein TMES_05645 [Thalassospira mesophila]